MHEQWQSINGDCPPQRGEKMILTISLNPSVDISYKLDHFLINTVNRVEDVSKTAGGKGLNVSRVLRQLGEDVTASGFLGGSLGGFIRTQIELLKIEDKFVKINGETRNCIAIIHEGKQTEILESGPVISESEATLFLKKFTNDVKQVDMVTISGSLPEGLPTNFYVNILKIAAGFHIPVLLDTNGALLTSILNSEYKPFLIKPNEEEFSELMGLQKVNQLQIIEGLKSGLFEDIPWVVVTLGADGAIIKHGQTLYKARAPKIEAINPVGSGDSVIGGFASGISRGLVDKELIKFGLAMGVLNALEEKTGHIDVEKVEWAIKQMVVEKI